MKTSHLTILNLVMGLLLLASPFLVQVTTSAGVYDPWSDLNADGEIDIFDVVTVAGAYLTTGDPAKSVYVQNWPATTQQTVFWYQTSNAVSPWYNASGFGHVRLTWYVLGLKAGETVRMWIQSDMQNEGATEHKIIAVGELEMGAGGQEGTISFPVPSELFNFYVQFEAGSDASVCVNFYLTWS